MPRAKSTTTAGKQAAFVAAQQGRLAPPKHIRLLAEHIPFWDAIIVARPRETWTDVDLAHAANLARAQADIERLSKEVLDEGDIIENARGTPIVNPKHSLLETLSRRAVALARMIHVHANATVGASEEQPPKLREEKLARDAFGTEDDGLIPKLRIV